MKSMLGFPQGNMISQSLVPQHCLTLLSTCNNWIHTRCCLCSLYQRRVISSWKSNLPSFPPPTNNGIGVGFLSVFVSCVFLFIMFELWLSTFMIRTSLGAERIILFISLSPNLTQYLTQKGHLISFEYFPFK